MRRLLTILGVCKASTNAFTRNGGAAQRAVAPQPSGALVFPK
jgi:hypothetical protein